MAAQNTTAEATSQEAASTGMTGLLPDVSKIRTELDRLGAENASLKAEVAQLGDDKAAAVAARDEAQARAQKLADLVDQLDAGEHVQREDGELRTGDLVLYRLLDVVTGDTLEGPAVIARVLEGGLVVAPISPLPLTLTTEAVQLVPAESLAR